VRSSTFDVIAKLIALVLPLGLDTFAVSAALGATGIERATRRRVAALFTLFEGGMPLIGVGLGAPLAGAVGGAAAYPAIVVLVGFGLYMVIGADEDEEAVGRLSGLHGPGVLLLGLSISLDELAIGFTLGLLRLPVALAVALIAGQAVVVTQLGLRIGHRLSERLRESAQRAAGTVLLLLGLVLLLQRVSQ
jgi:putative Mn2+ efflux pump MntP